MLETTLRASYRMAIEIEGETLSPVLPAGARIRTARPDEDRLLHDLNDRSFAGHWVGLSVDADNTTDAVGLYEGAGMHVVRRWDTWEKLA